jgi:hypothetical protein
MSAGSNPSASIPSAGANSYANQVTNNNKSNVTNWYIEVNGTVTNADQLIRELAPAIKKAQRDGIIDFGED